MPQSSNGLPALFSELHAFLRRLGDLQKRGLMKRKITSYQEGLRYLYGLQKYGIKFGLSSTSNLLKAFGNPHEGRSFVHIGGTNGKGSVAAFVASVLKHAGFKVGLYTSPHLVRFSERIRINDREIPEEMSGALIGELQDVVNSREPPTFFEATTAMALVYFARERTDIDVIEVGMGGRLDATNVILPSVAVITNISREHEAFLGSHLLDIASEKAGIIKPGIDVVTGAANPKIVELFERVSREKGASFWRLGRDVRYRYTATGLHYHGWIQSLHRLALGLRGPFQGRNAALALAAIERLVIKGMRVPAQSMREGLKSTVWPGRMHVLRENPTILLDGAHNPKAARTLAKGLRKGFRYKRLIVVLGVMKDKDIGGLVRAIVPVADYVVYSRPLYARAANPEILMAKARLLGTPGEKIPRLTRALDRARELARPEDMILVTGSLFTVGEAMAYLDPVAYRPDGL